MKENNIPDPAFWAITEKNGAQLIDPESELHGTIAGAIGTITRHGVIAVGDILVASKQSSVISPEGLDLPRDTISGYIVDPS